MICLVDAGDVVVNYRKGDLAVRHHVDEVLGDEGVAVYDMDVYSSSEFLVQILQAVLVLGLRFHIDMLSYQFGHVGYQPPVLLLGLHEHLVREILRAAGEHSLAELGSDWHLICQQVHFSRVKHLYHLLQRRGHFQLHFHPLVGRHLFEQGVVVAHRLVAVNEI